MLVPRGISWGLRRPGWHCSHSASEQSPTGIFSRSGRSQLTPHRPEEVTTLSTSSSWPPIYILITFLGKPSRPHSAWQAAGKTRSTMATLEGPGLLASQLSNSHYKNHPSRAIQPPLIQDAPTLALFTPIPGSARRAQASPSAGLYQLAKSNAQLPFPKVSERATIFPRHNTQVPGTGSFFFSTFVFFLSLLKSIVRN